MVDAICICAYYGYPDLLLWKAKTLHLDLIRAIFIIPLPNGMLDADINDPQNIL